MQQHRRTAAASAAAVPCPAPSPTADAVAARVVQAGAALALFEMSAWRHGQRLATAATQSRLAAALEHSLAPRALAEGASHLRWLIATLIGPQARPAGASASPAAACVSLVAALSRALEHGASEVSLGCGGRIVLRSLADAEDRSSAVGALADVNSVAPEQVLGVLEALEARGAVERVTPTGDAYRLTPGGARQVEADPLVATARSAANALDEDALWRLVRLGAVLVQARSETTATSETTSSPLS